MAQTTKWPSTIQHLSYRPHEFPPDDPTFLRCWPRPGQPSREQPVPALCRSGECPGPNLLLASVLRQAGHAMGFGARMTTWHHEERLKAVQDVVRHSGARRVLDLGCGAGDLFVRLAAQSDLEELVGVDICGLSLDRLRARLALCDVVVPRIALREGSMTAPHADLAGFDCAVLVESFEHIDLDRLWTLEVAVFQRMRPRTVVITTPNAEFNPLLGVPSHRMRHPDHRFEWDRARFRTWSTRAAGASGYRVEVQDIAGRHPELGGASQMAVFRMNEPQATIGTA